jgi:hypothetical protein
VTPAGPTVLIVMIVRTAATNAVTGATGAPSDAPTAALAISAGMRPPRTGRAAAPTGHLPGSTGPTVGPAPSAR